jgi:N-acetylmuramoyl-L-alanine amidase
VIYKSNLPIRKIVVHSTATPAGRDIDAKTITAWHRAKGYADIGYHYVIRLDGSIEKGRPDGRPGAHTLNHNGNSLGVVYAGGTKADAKTAEDTRTPAQLAAMETLLRKLKAEWPAAVILGHRDNIGARTACPSFDVKGWLVTLNPPL